MNINLKKDIKITTKHNSKNKSNESLKLNSLTLKLLKKIN